MTRKAILFLAALLLAAFLLPMEAIAQDSGRVDAGGSIETKPFLDWSGADDLSGSFLSGSTTAFLLDLRARGPKAAVTAGAGASLEASLHTGAAAARAWALALAGLAPADEFLAPSPAAAAAASAAAAAAAVPEALAGLRLRTAWVKLDAGALSATLGRQVLSYGRGALWSPVDIFSSLEASALSTTRRGIDALRLTAPFGETGLADLVAAPKSDPAAGRYAFRLSSLVVSGLDFGAVAAWDGTGERWQAGADFKLDLGASLYGELLYSAPMTGETGLFRAAAGGDWSVGDFGLAGEYYWNGGVQPSADPYAAGSHNLYAAISWKATDFLVLRAWGTWDIADEAYKIAFASSLDAAQNATLVFYLLGARTASAALPLAAELGAMLAIEF